MTYRYSYPALERVEKNEMRFYKDANDDLVPSVTTVLDATGDKSGIRQWRRKVGPAQADAIVQESTLIGSAVHEAIENYLLGQSWNEFTDDRSGYLAKSISSKFISSCLDGIDEVWGLESGLILDGLYAGTADCIGIYKGSPAIIDFKTAKKLKRKDWIEDYFLQCSAYANAHNVMFQTTIKDLVILMVDRDLLFKEFHIKNNEFSLYTDKWKKRLIKFHNRR
ncbi:preprotein translocase subunit TatA [Gammaproteobacteria bacterium]|nr:preprotein translocase subunit TatA [Gammaproteobacteria bacterium]